MSMLPNRIAALKPDATRRSIRNHCLAIGASGLVIVFGFGALGATTRLAGAVVATGTIVVKSSVKKVAHQTGGIVGVLDVEDGSHVAAGQVLIHLDETVAHANFAALSSELTELEAQRDRLEAERDGGDRVVFTPDLANAAVGDPDVARVLTGEARLFDLRRAARAGRKKQLAQRIAELDDEIAGFGQQATAKDGELAILRRELVGVKDLFARNLVQLPRLDGLERDEARIAGERGALSAQVAETKGKIAETELQIIQVDDDMRGEVGKQLADIRGRTAEVTQRKVAALDQLQHLDIRASQSGFVHELTVHAKGAVITPGETIMQIVPDADRLIAQVRVAPQDIDQVVMDQVAMLRFPSFNQRTTPEVTAHVARIAADTSQDGRSGAPYYEIQIALPSNNPVNGGTLRPGMPVEAFIQTSERTMMSYLAKPLADQIRRAFREK